MNQQAAVQKTILDELGLSDISQEKKDQLLIKMTEVILKRIFLETVEKLNESDQEAYAKMIDEKASPEAIDTFLENKINNYDAMIEKIVADFKEEMKKNLTV